MRSFRRRELPALAVVAAAELLTGRQATDTPGERQAIRRTADDDAVWAFYLTEPSVHFAANWLADSCRRVRLVVADVDAAGQILGPTANALAAGLLVEALGNQASTEELLADLARLLFVAGDSYVVLETSDGLYTGEACAYAPGVLTQNALGTGWNIDRGDGAVPLPDDAIVIRIWRPDPRRPIFADSPVRACLPTLRELQALRFHLISTIESRFASNSMLLFPSELDFPSPDTDVGSGRAQFASDLADMLVAGIDDPTSAAARVPQVVFGPAEYLAAIRLLKQDHEITAVVAELRESALRMLALGFSMPAEILTGMGGSGHWAAFAVENQAVKMAVEPVAQVISTGLYRAWFREALADNGLDPKLYALTFDSSDLKTPVDRGTKALEAFDRNLITEEATRADLGYTEGDAPAGPGVPKVRAEVRGTPGVPGSGVPDGQAPAV